MKNLPPLFLLGVFSACVVSRQDDLSALQPGCFVEAKGVLAGDAPRVDEIDEVRRQADDKPDKVEVVGPVDGAGPGGVRLLGHDFIVDAETGYEGADKQPVEPFTPATSEWLRLKARTKEDGLRARTLRRMEPRGQWKVTGEVRSVDIARGRLDVGGIVLPLGQEVDVALTRGRDPSDPLSLFLADDQKAVPFSIRVGEALRLGGQAAAGCEWNDEFDLDQDNAGDRRKPQAKGKIDALWLLEDRGSYALGEVSIGRNDTFREGGEHTHDDTLELTRGFMSLRVHDQVQVLVGRQDFDEEREWLYDEVLDGARVVVRAGPIEFEAAAAEGRSAAAEANEFEHTGLLVGNVRCQVDRDWMIGAYALQRTDDGAADFEPRLFGVRSIAEPRRGLGHWLEIGGARGDAGGRRVNGFAFDVGLLHTFDVAGRPSLGAGFAFGSGTSDGSGTSGYRQSGLQDNNGKLGGVTSVRYYGELFDPELANLGVATAVGAFRPAPGWSVSLLLHAYRQDVASTLGPDTGLRRSPGGGSRDLGWEADLVLGYRLERRLSLELVAATFVPGDAFSGDDAAAMLELTARWSF